MPRSASQSATYFARLKSPIGLLSVLASDQGLSEIRFANDPNTLTARREKRNEFIEVAIDQLNDYFAGKRQVFDVILDEGGTDFQRSVWAALRAIPFGVTASYGEIATVINNPKAARAVGMANNRNPLPIITPCHRVIGGDGSLIGFGGGLDIKRWLLEHERKLAHE